MLKRLAVAGAAIALLVVFVPAAGADPVGAKGSLAFPANCEGQTVNIVVNGNGKFNAAHDADSTATLVPQSLDVTFQFTPTGGTMQTDHQTVEKANQVGDDVTCTFDTTQTNPFGTFRIFGTAIGFFTPQP